MSWTAGGGSRKPALWQRLVGGTAPNSGANGALGGPGDGGSAASRSPAGVDGEDAVAPGGLRVYVRSPQRTDAQEFVELMQESEGFHRRWATAPTDVGRFATYLDDAARPDFEAFLVCRAEDDRIVGFFNLSQITRGSLQGAYLGYAAAVRYAGQGYMREGISLVLREAFVDLRLHRIEANIQPGNDASLALARGAGFKREGFSPRYLKINGQWRDHERWALLAEDWRRRQRFGAGADGVA
jgi:ribosomal-protein-alanine N-acetyltransferase